jgi:nitrate reductase gamma subunit
MVKPKSKSDQRIFQMFPVQIIPILLGVLVGLVLVLVIWGIWRSRSEANSNIIAGARGDILLWLLILAAFTLGVFVTYVLEGFHI